MIRTLRISLVFICTLVVPLFTFASTVFIDAVKAGDITEVSAYLEQGGDVNYQSSDGTTALHWAVYYDHTDILQRLIRAEAEVNSRNEYGSSPMLEAAENGAVQALQILLNAGADVESPNLDGQTALMTVARTGNISAATLLLDAGADPNKQEQWQLQTPLMWAAAQHQAEMVSLLLEKGAKANTISRVRVWDRRVTAEPRPQRRPPGGWTALSYAARQGCADCIDVLAAAGADLDQVSPEGITALLMATLNGRFNAAAALINAGADVNKWDFWGRSPLYSTVDFKTIPTGGRADRPSSDETSALDVIELLLAAGANPNVQLKLFPPYRDLGADRGADNFLTIGTTPLIRAAKAGDIESVRVLLSNGALVDLPTLQGMTPLIVASGEGSGVVDVRARYMNQAKNLEIAKLLLAAGADVNGSRDSGRTALHGAAGKGWNDFVLLLLESNAQINAEDNNGNTPLNIAMGQVNTGGLFGRRAPEVYPQTARLLLENGAAETTETVD